MTTGLSAEQAREAVARAVKPWREEGDETPRDGRYMGTVDADGFFIRRDADLMPVDARGFFDAGGAPLGHITVSVTLPAADGIRLFFTALGLMLLMLPFFPAFKRAGILELSDIPPETIIFYVPLFFGGCAYVLYTLARETRAAEAFLKGILQR